MGDNMKMRKVGDRVKIKPEEELKVLNGYGFDVIDIMYRYANKDATITEIIDEKLWSAADPPEYNLDIDGKSWTWYEILFKKL